MGTRARETRCEGIDRWWPTTQSMDLVEAPATDVGPAVAGELARFVAGERVESGWRTFATLDDAFGGAPEFTNVPTWFLVLPTRSRWSVVWTNTFLASGYDALGWNLTRVHGFTTMHFLAHDDTTTTQPGALFNHRRWVDGALVERSVYVGREDARWIFHQQGDPLPEEDTAAYGARRIRDRLNETSLMALLGRLGAAPWRASFYALDAPCFVAHRPDAPPTITRRTRTEVLVRRS